MVRQRVKKGYMRHFELKVIQPEEGGNPYQFRAQALGLLRVPETQDKGLSTTEVLRRNRVIKAIRAKQDGEMVLLEDDDWKTLREVTDSAHWNIADPIIGNFIEAVREAPLIDPEAIKVAPKEKGGGNGGGEAAPQDPGAGLTATDRAGVERQERPVPSQRAG